MWFFQLIAALGKDQFGLKVETVGRRFETEVLASQSFELSQAVVQKHRCLNWRLSPAGMRLPFFISPIADNLVRVR
jgi:hypothetical protein